MKRLRARLVFGFLVLMMRQGRPSTIHSSTESDRLGCELQVMQVILFRSLVTRILDATFLLSFNITEKVFKCEHFKTQPS